MTAFEVRDKEPQLFMQNAFQFSIKKSIMIERGFLHNTKAFPCGFIRKGIFTCCKVFRHTKSICSGILADHQ